MTNAPDLQYFVSAKMEELFVEWLDLPSTQKLVRRVINLAHGGMLIFKCVHSNFHRVFINSGVKSNALLCFIQRFTSGSHHT